jgi:hypothetical protein
MRQRTIPVYDFEIPFAQVLGIRHETLRRHIELGFITPDAKITNGRPLFLAEAASVERHRESILAYRSRTVLARENMKATAIRATKPFPLAARFSKRSRPAIRPWDRNVPNISGLPVKLKQARF